MQRNSCSISRTIMETYDELPYREINHPAKKLNRLFKSEILNIKTGFGWWKYSV